MYYIALKSRKTQRFPPKMMTKTDSTRFVQDDLFRVMLSDLVAKDHELV